MASIARKRAKAATVEIAPAVQLDEFVAKFSPDTSAADLDTPAVRALMAETLKRADPPLDPKAKRRIIIKSIAKPKPRRR